MSSGSRDFNGFLDCVSDIAAADLLQGAEYFNVALVTCSTLDNVLIFLTLALGAKMLQTGLALQDKEKRCQYKLYSSGKKYTIVKSPFSSLRRLFTSALLLLFAIDTCYPPIISEKLNAS